MAPNNEPRKYLTAYEEIQAVPRQWEIKFEGKNKRVAFYRLIGTKLEAQGTYEHPIFGWLPRPWELRKRPGAEGYYYYNISTDESVEHGPRKVRRPPSPPPGSIRVRREGMGTLVRQEISRTPLYDKYPRVFTLDAGDGYIGGMNGGVYVVRSTKTKQPYVEKVFRGTHAIYERLAKSEIEMMRRLIHNSIIHYIEAYVKDNPFQASVYMEFCDRGSLDDLIRKYKAKKKAHEPDRIPESFMWHAFVGLADALGYLQTGQSHVSMPLEKNNRNEWTPIVHCDIKPGNIFLRSRDTPGSTKPFYTLLSDFGLMGYEQKNTPAPYGAYGTIEFHAPELNFDPYPQDDEEVLMASPHSCKSDVWALACSIFCMCERDELAHMDRNCWPLRSKKAMGRAAKRPSLDITDTGIYSDYLARTIAWAASRDPSQRPDPWELVVEVKAQHDLWLEDPNWEAQVKVNGALPPWATKKFTL